MNPIETLMAEHRLIEQVLGALESYLQRLRSGEPLDRADLARFVGFVREFADAYHHGKEEDLLFAAMVENGFPRDTGPIAVMLDEHDQGRRLVAKLAALMEAKSAWTTDERQQASSAGLEYAALLRQHISKEDRILYPMAEARLGEAAIGALADAFERFEAARGGAERRLTALAEWLVASYVEGRRPAEAGCAEVAGPQGSCCCCGGDE